MAKGVEAVERALAIVDAFKSGVRTLSLKEIAEVTSLNKATILRLIVSLEKFHYISRMGEGRYALGPALSNLGAAYQRSFRLVDYVIPVLEELTTQTGETSAFFIRDGQSRVCLRMVESTNTLRSHLREGDVRPLLPGGTGVILMAFSSDESKPDLDRARQDYVVHNIGERHPEIASVAVPVFHKGDQLAGALSISGPISHFGPDHLGLLTTNALRGAAKLTSQLGGNNETLNQKLQSMLTDAGLLR